MEGSGDVFHGKVGVNQTDTQVTLPGPADGSVPPEDVLVAELETLGLRYLARQTSFTASKARPPSLLLADLVRQPNARIRSAVIAVFLAHPSFAVAVPAAMSQLRRGDASRLRCYYTAALLLQQEYAPRLRKMAPSRWRQLPDLFSREMGLSLIGTPRERLFQLGRLCEKETGVCVNWAGTFDNVARQLLRRWELEARWNT